MQRYGRLRHIDAELFNDPDETKALPRHREDQALRLTGIPDRAARRIDAIIYRRLRYGAAIPHGLQQLVPADHAIRILHEIN